MQKMIGAIIMRMSATNASPIGFSLTANSGAMNPTAMPRSTATMTPR